MPNKALLSDKFPLRSKVAIAVIEGSMKKLFGMVLLVLCVKLNAECPVSEHANIADIGEIKKIRWEHQALLESSSDDKVVNCLYRAALAEAQQAYSEGKFSEAIEAATVLVGLDPSDSWGNLILLSAVQQSGNNEKIPLKTIAKSISRSSNEARFLRKLAEDMLRD